MSGKWPRHYAGEIIALSTQEARRGTLARVPDIFRDWVNELVVDHFKKRAALKARAKRGE